MQSKETFKFIINKLYYYLMHNEAFYQEDNVNARLE